MKIKTGDTVKVITGHYKGTTGKVTSVNPTKNTVTVEGVNIAKKANKPTQANPDGGITQFEAPINASNVMVVDDNNAVSRVGHKIDKNGNKVRVYKTTGKEIKGGKK